MAWSRLQSAPAGSTSGTSVTSTFTTANLSAGSKIIAYASIGATTAPAITSVTATGGNTLTQVAVASQANARIYIYACDASGAGGSSMVGTKPTITASWSGSGGGLGLVVQEISGLLAGNTTAMCDGSAGTLTGTASSTGDPTYADTAAGQFKAAAYGDFGTGFTVGTNGSWTADANNVNASTNSNCLVQFKSSTGAQESDGFTSADSGGWAVAEIAFKLAPAAAGVTAAQPGRTWLRQFRHRQQVLPPPAAAAAAPAPQVFQVLPPRNPRPSGRGRLGRAGACAAGILAVTTLSPQPSSVPPAHPGPVISHPAPHRAAWRGILVPPQQPSLTAKLPPTAISPRPRHRATGKGILAKTTLSPQPAIVTVLPQPVPVRRPGPHRVLWRGTAGPPPAAVAAAAAAPARPQPVTNRPPAPHRAIIRAVLAKTTLSPQPASVPGPQWRQPNAPRPPHRAAWRAVAGPAPAVVAVTAVPPSRPAPVTNRPPAPRRAITRRILAAPPPLAPPSRPAPTTNRPPPPHRAVVRGILAKTTLAAQPARVSGPQWRQPNAPRPAHRALWRRIAGAAPPPPPFTIGALTAADAARNALTASGGSSALTAAGAGLATLTATDQRTGGPG